MTLALIGFMAAGKTSAGREIAKALGLEFADADAEIENRAGKPIREIFEGDGEQAFRTLEAEVCAELLTGEGVVALGGGAVESEAVCASLADVHTVWCEVDPDTAWDRAQGSERPLAADRAEFDRRFEQRAPLYAELADSVIPAGGKRVGAPAARWIGEAADRGGRMIWAESSGGAYPVLVAPGAASALGAASAGASISNGTGTAPHRWFAVADEGALAAHPDALGDVEATITVSAGEQSKTLAEAERVLRELTDLGARRDDGIVAFGGGVVGDLAGFCAATFQRGVEVVQIPTTLVAQVDSAYGGKTGVDLPQAKNYVGAYKLPRAVLVDPAYLATLPAEELAAGFAEVVKTALIAGGTLWERVRTLDALSAEKVGPLVFDCARTKIAVVATDERDTGRRAVLNLGHTIGHAVETATGYEAYRHGEAVGLGLLGALRLSGDDSLRDEVQGLLELAGLPTRLDVNVDAGAIMEAMERDKKQTVAGLGFVLVESPGTVTHGNAVPEGDVRAALEELSDG